jgi:hypothetical protein
LLTIAKTTNQLPFSFFGCDNGNNNNNKAAANYNYIFKTTKKGK